MKSIVSAASLGLKFACFYRERKLAAPISFLPWTSNGVCRGVGQIKNPILSGMVLSASVISYSNKAVSSSIELSILLPLAMTVYSLGTKNCKCHAEAIFWDPTSCGSHEMDWFGSSLV